MKWKFRYIDVPSIPIGGHDYGILDLLLQKTGYYDKTGQFILLYTTSQNIKRFSHLIWDKDNPYEM